MTIPPDGQLDRFNAALASYLSGEADEETCRRIDLWAAKRPENARYLANLRTMWVRTAERQVRWNTEAAIARVSDRLARPKADLPARRVKLVALPTHAGREVASAPRWWIPAAVAVAVVGAAALEARTSTPQGRFRPPVVSEELVEVATKRGQLATVTLSDGSNVLLGPLSKLRYTRAYGHPRRDVHLEGRARFTVTHDTARPFAVHTARGIATDLGTTFSVDAHDASGALEVVVAEGKVMLMPKDSTRASEPLTLTRADRGRLTETGALIAEHGVAIDAAFAWTEGRLQFDNTPVIAAIREIGRWYDVELRIGDPAIGGRHLTASFQDQPLAEVLRLLGNTMRLDVERHGRVITLRSQRGPGSDLP